MPSTKAWRIKNKPSHHGASPKWQEARLEHSEKEKEKVKEDDQETCPGSEDGSASQGHSSGDESWSPASPVVKPSRTKLSGGAAPFVPGSAGPSPTPAAMPAGVPAGVPAGTPLALGAPLFTPTSMAAPIGVPQVPMDGVMCPVPMPYSVGVGLPMSPPHAYSLQAFQPQLCAPGQLGPLYLPGAPVFAPGPGSPAMCFAPMGATGAAPFPSTPMGQWPLMPEPLPSAAFGQPQQQGPGPLPELPPAALETEATVNTADASPKSISDSPCSSLSTSGSCLSKKSNSLSWADIDDDDEFESPWGV